MSESTSQQQAPAELSVNINLSQDNNINVNSKSPLNLGNNNSEPNQTAVVVDKTTAQHQEKIEEEKTEVVEDEKENSPAVVINTEVYLNGMTHSDSPAGLLPRFSSWSLISIGKYTDYNPHTGWNLIILTLFKSSKIVIIISLTYCDLIADVNRQNIVL